MKEAQRKSLEKNKFNQVQLSWLINMDELSL